MTSVLILVAFMANVQQVFGRIYLAPSTVFDVVKLCGGITTKLTLAA